MSTPLEAEAEGRWAYIDGETKNPYPKGSPQHLAWELGWISQAIHDKDTVYLAGLQAGPGVRNPYSEEIEPRQHALFGLGQVYSKNIH